MDFANEFIGVHRDNRATQARPLPILIPDVIDTTQGYEILVLVVKFIGFLFSDGLAIDSSGVVNWLGKFLFVFQEFVDQDYTALEAQEVVLVRLGQFFSAGIKPGLGRLKLWLVRGDKVPEHRG